MSIDYYQSHIDHLNDELARLEGKVATALEGASREREAGHSDEGAAARTSSQSAAKSYRLSAQRHQERALRYDKNAARAQGDLANKRRALNAATRELAEAERRERERTRRQALAPIMGYLPAAENGMGITTASATPSPRDAIGVSRWEEDTTVDAALDIGKAVALGALASVPVIGPILSEVVSASWGNNRVDRAIRFAEALGRDIEALQNRLDHDFVKHREFEALAEDVIERVVQRRNEGKANGFAAIVAHSATFDRPEQRERERFVDWLEQLRPHQIEVLRRLAQPKDGWIRPAEAITVGAVVSSRLGHLLQDVPIDSYDWSELQRRSLVASLDDSAGLVGAASDHRRLLTDTGRRFVEFIASPSEVLTTDAVDAIVEAVPDPDASIA
jgi:hypothetical protein